jgi:hypothetical protein
MAVSEDSAILEVSFECKSALLKKQDSKDTDIMSNYSTSLEGSMVMLVSSSVEFTEAPLVLSWHACSSVIARIL